MKLILLIFIQVNKLGLGSKLCVYFKLKLKIIINLDKFRIIELNFLIKFCQIFVFVDFAKLKKTFYVVPIQIRKGPPICWVLM